MPATTAPGSASAYTSVYTVTGMTCAHCVASVTAEVQKIPGVQGVDVELATGQVSVTAGTAVDDAAVTAAVQEAGYEVTSTPEAAAGSCCGTCH